MMNLLIKLQDIDRRILYLLVAVILAVPLLNRPSDHPKHVFPEVQNAYDVIDSVPKGKIVFLSNSWGAGTKAENEPQLEALMRHMFAKRIKFVMMSWDPAGSDITYQTAMEVQKDMGATYGVDWAHMGYKTGAANAIIGGLSEDFQRVMGQDKRGTKLDKIPVARNIKNYKQIGAVVDISSVGLLNYWIAYLTTPKHIPLIYSPTAVMSAGAYPYLDSGQLAGMLNGVMGAVQYETLIGLGDEPTDAAAISWALSAAHIYIIVLIILGNLGYLAAKRARNGGPRVG